MKETNEKEEDKIIKNSNDDIKNEAIKTNTNKNDNNINTNICHPEKNMEFDENIFFNHYFLTMRKFQYEPTINGDSIPYIMAPEFLNANIMNKKNIQDATKETIHQILGRIKQFTNSKEDNFNKLFLKNIKSYTEILGIEKASTILFPLFYKILEDKINTKIEFAKNLLPLIDFLYFHGNEGIKIIENSILPVIEEFFKPSNNNSNKLNRNKNNKKIQENIDNLENELTKLLSENFIKASKIIIDFNKSHNINNTYMLNKILSYARKDEEEINLGIKGKKLCVEFIAKLGCELGDDITYKYLLPQMEIFLKDKDVKEDFTRSLPDLLERYNVNFLSQFVFELFNMLSTDKSQIIRKTVIEIFPRMILITEQKSYNIELKKYLDILEKMMNDPKKKVRYAIINNIGEILKVLEKNQLTNELFDFYIKTIENYYDDKDELEIETENDLKKKSKAYYFAYNFPAVLKYYGKEQWSKLKKILILFCNDTNDNQVIFSIISSFHEISKLVGENITTSDLLPLYDKFLQSKNNFIKKLSEDNLYKLLTISNNKIKENYFTFINNTLYNFNTNDNNNIINNKIINKKIDYLNGLKSYFNLYENEKIYNSILPICIQLCTDKAFIIRKKSSKILGEIILDLYNQNYKKDELIEILEVFSFNKKFKQRINFINICKSILNVKSELCEEKIKEILFVLVKNEKVFDVKISLGKLFLKIINKKLPYCDDPFIHYLCKILDKNDCDTITEMFKDVNLLKNEEIEYNIVADDEIKKTGFNRDFKFFNEQFNLSL